uniref:Zeaxanthin epoxidase n=1 Tax=Scrippsiella trochoidea TaxID=71861 RepID=A0A1N7THA8_SCRTR|nr:zeaxanthin epoxidase [Scrippsiella trochoidea]
MPTPAARRGAPAATVAAPWQRRSGGTLRRSGGGGSRLVRTGVAACCLVLLLRLVLPGAFVGTGGSPKGSLGRRRAGAAATATAEAPVEVAVADTLSDEEPLHVLVAGAGVGGLALANALARVPKVKVTVLEKTSEFKRFGGPIQLASNAMQNLKELDGDMYGQIESKATWTGNLTNGIKDGIRSEWYAMFDLKSPAADRSMPFTCVVERPDLQEIMLGNLPKGIVKNGAGVVSYEHAPEEAGVVATLDNGETIHGDVLIGADGIWSATRATMHGNDLRGDSSGASYSGYTVYAGELYYDSPDNGEVGYKVYIGPNQYFVVTDIGKGRYQWYAFLAKPVGTAESEASLKPTVEVDGCASGNPAYLREVFEGWSHEIHDIIRATRDDEIQQRDLYDRPPSLMEPWHEGRVALLGDAIHAMMPNLGQGGCQAMEDAIVIAEELSEIARRSEVPDALARYKGRRLIRSASVQGLSRFASDIIIRGFDTPAKITTENGLSFENFGYAGIVTRMLQPILPVFFTVQFNFLYNDYRNRFAVDFGAAAGFLVLGGLLLLAFAAGVFDAGLLAGLGLEGALTSAEGTGIIETLQTVAPEVDSLL